MDGLLDALATGLEFALAGVPIAAIVALVVQGAKVMGYVESDNAPKAAIFAGAFLGLGWLATYLFSGADLTVGYIVDGLTRYVIGVLEAGILYQGAKFALGRYAGIQLGSPE